MNNLHKLLWIVWALLVAAGLWYSLLPGVLVSQYWWARYADHGVGFFILGLVGVLASRGTGRAVVLVSFLIGLLIELLQLGVTGRHFEWSDLFEDALGLSLGWLAVWWLRRRLNAQTAEPPAG